jgi:hypothetical protein
MGPAGVSRCPVDDTALDQVENIVEPAIQSALQQSAAVHVVREPYDDDGERLAAPLAALLRY